MCQKRIPEDAGGEKGGDVWVWVCGGHPRCLSARCMGELTVSRMVDWLLAVEMVNPSLCPPHVEKQSRLEVD